MIINVLDSLLNIFVFCFIGLLLYLYLHEAKK